MEIPKYVQELMSRSSYVFSSNKIILENINYASGYTIRIQKRTEYTMVDTLRSEVERLVKWANRKAGFECAYILYVPAKTHYRKQSAVVTIFDPIMQKIEQFLPEKC